MVLMAQQALKVPLEPLVLMVPLDQQALKAQLVLLGKLVLLVLLVLMV
jgi:hypothetical protein